MNIDLRENRKKLYNKLLSINSIDSLMEFQIELSKEIQNTERTLKSEKKEELKRHIHLLKCYGDSCAWMFLHPHSIRQLYKNEKNKGYLIDQGKAFENTINLARDVIAKLNLPVLIADLTHCINIGDLIICSDPEVPEIIECKSGMKNNKYTMQGRRGRQLSRMKGTKEYLKKGQAKVYGEIKERLCLELELTANHNWNIVNSVLRETEKVGQSFYKLSEYEIIGAILDEIEMKIEEHLQPCEFSFKNPIVASHYRAVKEAWPTFAPPVMWNIDKHFKFKLMEGEIMLFHVFDPIALLGFTNGSATITKIDVPIAGTTDQGYEIEINHDQKWILSSVFTDKILYGYETVDSVGNSMLESSQKATEKVWELSEKNS